MEVLLVELSPGLVRWRDGAIGRASDLQFIGRGFESCLRTIVQWP